LFSILTLPTPEVSNRKLPPKRIIGIGYRDKGTARDPAIDGSPSWQEVASQAGQLALAIKSIKGAKSFNAIITAFEDLGLISKGEGDTLKTNPSSTKETLRKESQTRG
jgi:hypothetical protein